MRTLSHLFRQWLWLTLCLAVLGCQKAATPTAPNNASVPTTPVVVSFGVGESIPAMLEVTIDPTSMSATSRPLTARTAAGFQASQFDLDITKFQTKAQFDVQSVQFTEIGDVEVTFRHAHPWKAVDISQPPSATNRADLGYTGRLLILADLEPADIPSHTFFTDVKANTELIRGADGYVQPGDLLAKSGFNANCFPYMLLADEAKDNRIGVSNGGIVTGNWDPAVGGWQRSNLGPNGDGWTGYDFVHAGQTIENSFVLNADELTDGPVTLQVALLIKYTEPKGVGGEVGRTLRLPPATVDVLQFAYRAPHAALDCTGVFGASTSEPWLRQIESTVGSTLGATWGLRDWDATEGATAQADVSTDPDIATVEPGTPGHPLVSYHCPALDPAIVPWTNVTPSASGLPETGGYISFDGVVTNQTGAVAGQDLSGLIRVVDPGDGLSTGSFHLGLNPDDLTPLPSGPARLQTFMGMNCRIVDPPPVWVDQVVDASGDVGDFPSVVMLDQGTADPLDDRLAITYRDNLAKKIKLARATVQVPSGPADWSIHILDSTGDSGFDTCLVPYRGGLAVSYMDHSGTGSVCVAYTPSTAPASAADWTVCEVATGIGTISWDTALTVVPNGQLAATFLDGEERMVYVTLAQSLAPLAASDWLTYALGDSGVEEESTGSQISSFEGRLIATYRDKLALTSPIFCEAITLVPLSTSDWQFSKMSDPLSAGGTGRPSNFLICDGDLQLTYGVFLARHEESALNAEESWDLAYVRTTDFKSDFRLHSFDGVLPIDCWRGVSGGTSLGYWARKALKPRPRQHVDMHEIRPILDSIKRDPDRNTDSCVAYGRLIIANGQWDNALHLAYNPQPW